MRCLPTYTCKFMGVLEQALLQTQDHQPFLWHRHIDDISFIWTHGDKRLQTFSEKLNKFHPNTKFTDESHKEKISLLDLNVRLADRQLETDL